MQLLDVLQASPDQLQDLVLGISTSDPDDVQMYAKVRLAYLTSDVKTLEDLLDQTSEKPNLKMVHLLAKLRLEVRTQSSPAGAATFAKLKSLAQDYPEWEVETLTVIALHAEAYNDDENAKKHYEFAFEAARRQGMPKRACACFMNAIAAAQRLDPTRRLTTEYERAVRLAREAEDHGTLGAALVNLSREYQLMGAPILALSKINMAIGTLTTHYFGTYQYFLALAQRCHVFLDIGNVLGFRQDYEEIFCCAFAEARATLLPLEALAKSRNIDLPVAALSRSSHGRAPATWLERSHPTDQEPLLTDLETKLIEIVAEQPRTRVELISILYGSNGDYFSLENRLKQIMHRVKAKKPGLILRVGGKYQLAQ